VEADEAMRSIDLNSDMGESFGVYRYGADDEIIEHITSSNIACGAHAGDPNTILRTIRLAKEHKVSVGGHPGYPDLQGFGRRSIDFQPAEIANYVIFQLGALQALARVEKCKVGHVKLHGALYNNAMKNPHLMMEIAEMIQRLDPQMIIVVQAGLKATQSLAESKVRIAREAFADRGYMATGELAPRDTEGAILRDPKVAASRVVRLLETGRLKAVDGTELEIGEVETICIHSDSPGASEIAKTVKQTLMEVGFTLEEMHPIR
jgi:UPF0271 protein